MMAALLCHVWYWLLIGLGKDAISEERQPWSCGPMRAVFVWAKSFENLKAWGMYMKAKRDRCVQKQKQH